ncbi:MAG: tetratricopeptide repeat protein [Scytolyngbya sp. HA4215-MV1]|jgi:tetratricopeptide (TPR) repeat protein|nr:tetratricopeptide repeat protein [Scytolyngbya sp. HA4215-MV1]
MYSDFNSALEHYQTELEQIRTSADCSITPQQILRLLNARDRAATILTNQRQISPQQSVQLLQLDEQLKQQAERLTRTVSFEDLRRSLSAPSDAWWWQLDAISLPSHALDYFWKGLTVITWATNLGLLANIISRFVLGGPGVGGVFAIALPSILALLQAKNELTESGWAGFQQLLERWRVPRRLREEVHLGATLTFLAFLLVFWFCLPKISEWYNHQGLADADAGKVGSAVQNYERAIALNPDNVAAHFNLGSLYEDLQEFDKAQKQYLIAVKGDLPEAYNNLGRLYLRNKRYPEAVVLLQQGLQRPGDLLPEMKYSLFKNLGWVRLQQGRTAEAQAALQVAVSLARDPETQKYIEFPGSAHCLLAKVLEKEKLPGAIAQWQKCAELASNENPDEDVWVHEAQLKMNAAKKASPNP